MRRLLALIAVVGLAVAALWWRPEWALEAEYARLRWLAGAEVASLHAAEHRWSYLQAGPADAPLVVLVHGFTASKETWLPLMRELHGDYRLIAPDLPGWNQSERLLGADYGVATQAGRLAAFLAALGKPAALLVGHSMGGHIAGLTAAGYPERVPRLALLSSGGVRFPPNDFVRAVQAGERPFEVTDRDSLQRYLNLVFTEPPWVPWPVDRALVRQRRLNQSFEREVLDRLRGPDADLLQRRLSEVKASTLLLWCRDDRVIDAAAMEVFAAGLPSSVAVMLEGCGHMPQMAAPKETAAALRTFFGQR